MIYDPLIDALAALPLTLLVKAADNQHAPNQTACFCPICKGQSTPHFIIYENEDGGVYGKPMQRWASRAVTNFGVQLSPPAVRPVIKVPDMAFSSLCVTHWHPCRLIAAMNADPVAGLTPPSQHSPVRRSDPDS